MIGVGTICTAEIPYDKCNKNSDIVNNKKRRAEEDLNAGEVRLLVYPYYYNIIII